MGASVGQIDLDLHVNQNGLQSQLNGLGNSAGGMLSGAFMKLGGIIAAAFAVRQLVRFGSDCIELASNLNEVQNVVDVTFGKMSSQVDSFAKTAITQFGLSEYSAKKYASTMGAMLKSSGVTGTGMLQMSTGLAGLAGDMASFYNLNTDDAFTKIQAGISGEIMPLKQLGINMSVANMEAYALSQGITQAYSKMDQASQSTLRYKYLLSVTKDAQGDFARTSGAWANQTRILATQFNSLKGTLGQGFINILTPVLAGLNALIVKLQIAAKYFTAFTVMLFGSAAAKDSAASKAAMATTQAAQGVAAANDKVAGSSDKVGKAAKKAAAAVKGSVSGFDMLNVIGKDAAGALDDAAGGLDGLGGAGGGIGGDFSIPEVKVPDINTDGLMSKLEPFKAMLASLIAPLKAIDFTPLTEAFQRLGQALKPFVRALFAGLEWAYFNILVPLAKWYIEDYLPAWLDVVSAALNVLSPLLEVFKPLAMWLLNEFLLPIAAFTGGVIVQVLRDIAAVLNDIGDWMKNHIEDIRVMGTVVAGFFAAWKLTELMAFVQMSGGVVAALKNVTGGVIASVLALGKQAAAAIVSAYETGILTAMYAKDFVVGIGKATAAIVINTGETLYLKALYGVDMIKAIAASIVSMGQQVVQWGINTAAVIANKVEALLVKVMYGVDMVIAFAKSVVAMIAQAVQWALNTLAIIANKLAMLAGTIAQVAMTVATVAWSVAGAIATGVTTAFGIAVAILTSPIGLVILAIAALVIGIALLVKNWDKVKATAADVWEGIKKVWSNVGAWFSTNVVDPIAKVFKGLWNGIIDGMNFVIRGLNKLKIPAIKTPLGDIGGFGISLNEIPRLANGGLVSSPTLAMVGDNKNASIDPEVVSPLSKLQNMMGGGNQAVVEALMMILDAIEKLNLNVELDGEKLGRALYPHMYNEQVRVGNKSIITVGGM